MMPLTAFFCSKLLCHLALTDFAQRGAHTHIICANLTGNFRPTSKNRGGKGAAHCIQIVSRQRSPLNESGAPKSRAVPDLISASRRIQSNQGWAADSRKKDERPVGKKQPCLTSPAASLSLASSREASRLITAHTAVVSSPSLAECTFLVSWGPLRRVRARHCGSHARIHVRIGQHVVTP